MEMLRKVTKRKKKSEKEAEKPSEIDLDMDLEERKVPQPAMMVEADPIDITNVPKGPEVSVEMQDMRRLEKEEEAQALDTFRQRISTYRNSQARYQNPMAPGFDYANWKPYGKIRYRNQRDEFERMAHNLAPYVACVLESACVGQEEQRWAAMTQMHPEEAAVMESLQASRQVSRAASRDRLAP